MLRLEVKTWSAIHRWSSLIGSAFLLLVCVTGLPLIFADEIEAVTTPPQHYAHVANEAARPSLDQLVSVAKRMFPGQIVTSIFIDDEEPQTIVYMAPSFEALTRNPDVAHFIRFDRGDGRVLQSSTAADDDGASPIIILYRLHADLFAGLLGELFVGAIGVTLLTATVSGIVLYGPFTRKLRFGELRTIRRRVRWLDIHNLLGIATMAWAVTVGATGVMNELSTPLFAIWQQTDVREALRPWQGKPVPHQNEIVPARTVFDAAARALPDRNVINIVYPGGTGGSPHHFLVWSRGKTPLTKRLLNPMLIDARTGRLTTIIRMPWYLRALEVSRPLHFGDYGGLPLKMIWAAFDIVMIVLLGSGIYLWIGRPRRERIAKASSASPQLETAE